MDNQALETDVARWRKAARDGIEIKQIAQLAGVSHGVVYKAVKGETFNYTISGQAPLRVSSLAAAKRKIDIDTVSTWRRQVRNGVKTVAQIVKESGHSMSTVDGIVYGDRVPDAEEPPCARKNPGKTANRLTDDQVRAIRAGEKIARVSKSTISKIRNGKLYKEVN